LHAVITILARAFLLPGLLARVAYHRERPVVSLYRYPDTTALGENSRDAKWTNIVKTD